MLGAMKPHVIAFACAGDAAYSDQLRESAGGRQKRGGPLSGAIAIR